MFGLILIFIQFLIKTVQDICDMSLSALLLFSLLQTFSYFWLRIKTLKNTNIVCIV